MICFTAANENRNAVYFRSNKHPYIKIYRLIHIIFKLRPIFDIHYFNHNILVQILLHFLQAHMVHHLHKEHKHQFHT